MQLLPLGLLVQRMSRATPLCLCILLLVPFSYFLWLWGASLGTAVLVGIQGRSRATHQPGIQPDHRPQPSREPPPSGQTEVLELRASKPPPLNASSHLLRLDLTDHLGKWYQNFLRGTHCTAMDPVVLRRWRCPQPAQLYVDAAQFAHCTFCNYLHRANPVQIEPIVDEIRVFRRVGNRTVIANKARMRWRWANQSRLAALVPVEQARQRAYLDFGSRTFESSIKGFLDDFPQAGLFDLKVCRGCQAGTALSEAPDCCSLMIKVSKQDGGRGRWTVSTLCIVNRRDIQ